MKEEDENWKAIVGYDGYYEVSDRGRIRGVSRYVKHSTRGCVKLLKSKELKISVSGNGYNVVALCVDNNKSTKSVHRLVAECFRKGYEEGLVVNHKDGIKTNNHCSNLEWVTYKENTQHSFDNFLQVVKKGEDNAISCEYNILNPEGGIIMVRGLKHWCDLNNFPRRELYRILSGDKTEWKGWSISKVQQNNNT